MRACVKLLILNKLDQHVEINDTGDTVKCSGKQEWNLEWNGRIADSLFGRKKYIYRLSVCVHKTNLVN